ncbi:MAG: adenylate/guanylate cyclase domain-containing protein [Maribacter sp.]|uniref:adenylate/guanylate cyclase domain-containing protein n=1 Tax=Maribacter sp. TaxID=1897614 RepID=UPI00329A7A58
MFKKSFLFIVLFTNCSIFGQSKTSFSDTELDSLWSVWKDETKADTIRLSALGLYSYHGYIYSQPDSAFYFADLQHTLAKKIGSKKHISYALATKGTALWVKGDYKEALRYNKEHLELALVLGDKLRIASSFANLGIVYGNLGDDIKQIEYLEKSLKLREELGNKSAIAFSLSNIGELYRVQQNFDKALEYQLRCLKLRKEVGDQADIAFTLSNIGQINTDQKNYDAALEYLLQSLSLGEKHSDKKDLAMFLSSIGDVYKEKLALAKALNYYRRSILLQEEIGDRPEIAESLVNMGGLYFVQKEYRIGVEKCEEAYAIALETSRLRTQKIACQCLYDNYKALGNTVKALEYHEKMLQVGDSLKSNATSKKLQQMEFARAMLADSIAQAESERKIEAAHLEEVRKKNQTRNVAIAIGAGIFVLALLLYNRLNFVRKSKAELQVEKNRSENLLLNILPEEIAQELKDNGRAVARDFEKVSILFTDFKSFTQTSEKLSAQELVKEINVCFEAFDGIIDKWGIEKIKTIGDAYMAAGGLPLPSEDSVKNTILAALEMQTFISERIKSKRAKNETPFEMRLGIHTGAVVAGIVGVKKFQYDVWGDTVNIASRIESSGAIGKVNISQDTFQLVNGDSRFSFESRGKIPVKGKMDMEMYFVTKAS